MEKLFNLLNEYITSKWWDEIKCYAQMYRFFFTEYLENIPEYVVISKEFWFIKWLVDNNKIDVQWAKNLLYESEIFNPLPYTDLSERLIMYLAIQDEPITLLISVLK